MNLDPTTAGAVLSEARARWAPGSPGTAKSHAEVAAIVIGEIERDLAAAVRTGSGPDSPDGGGKHATHVVVDTHDGYTFWRDGDGVLFTGPAAAAFAAHRNQEMKPAHQLYTVFRLEPAGHDCAAADAAELNRMVRADDGSWLGGADAVDQVSLWLAAHGQDDRGPVDRPGCVDGCSWPCDPHPAGCDPAAR